MLQIGDGFLHSGPQSGFDVLDGFETWTAGCCWLFCLHSEVVSKKRGRANESQCRRARPSTFALYDRNAILTPVDRCEVQSAVMSKQQLHELVDRLPES